MDFGDTLLSFIGSHIFHSRSTKLCAMRPVFALISNHYEHCLHQFNPKHYWCLLFSKSPDATLSSCRCPTCHSGPAQNTKVIAEHQPARPRCSPAADWGKAWHVQSERQHPPYWPTPAFTSALGSISLNPHSYSMEENILIEVVGSQPPPVKLSGSHMALAGDEEKISA